MADAPSLRELQLRLRALITRPPSGDTAGELAHLSGVEDLPIRGDAQLDAAARVEIYAHMYFARIRDAIAEDYGALCRALGDERFDRLLRDYLDAHPPRDPSLRRAADGLAGFVARARAHRPELIDDPWLPELARFEGALVEAFDAVDEPVLEREALASLAPEAWPEIAIRPVASLVLLEPTFAVERLRAELLVDDAIAPPPHAEADDRPLRVWRQKLRVYFRRIDRHELAALRLAVKGASFAEVCAAMEADASGADPAEAALALLSRWLDDALLVDTLSPTSGPAAG